MCKERTCAGILNRTIQTSTKKQVLKSSTDQHQYGKQLQATAIQGIPRYVLASGKQRNSTTDKDVLQKLSETSKTLLGGDGDQQASFTTIGRVEQQGNNNKKCRPLDIRYLFQVSIGRSMVPLTQHVTSLQWGLQIFSYDRTPSRHQPRVRFGLAKSCAP